MNKDDVGSKHYASTGKERGALANDNVGMGTDQETNVRNQPGRNLEEAQEGGVPGERRRGRPCGSGKNNTVRQARP